MQSLDECPQALEIRRWHQSLSARPTSQYRHNGDWMGREETHSEREIERERERERDTEKERDREIEREKGGKEKERCR